MSKDLVVTAKVPRKVDDEGNLVNEEMEATAVVQTAETLDEAKEMFGEEAVLSNMNAAWKVTLQGNIRSSLRSGLTPEQVAEKLAPAKLGVATSGGRVDPQAAFIAKFKMATQEEQAAMIEQLRAAAEG